MCPRLVISCTWTNDRDTIFLVVVLLKTYFFLGGGGVVEKIIQECCLCPNHRSPLFCCSAAAGQVYPSIHRSPFRCPWSPCFYFFVLSGDLPAVAVGDVSRGSEQAESLLFPAAVQPVGHQRRAAGAQGVAAALQVSLAHVFHMYMCRKEKCVLFLSSIHELRSLLL